MTREQIKAEFNDELSSEAKKKLDNDRTKGIDNTNAIYVRVKSGMEPMPACGPTPGLLGGLEVSPLRDVKDNYYRVNNNLICVYECE